MNQDWLTETFEEHRAHLRAVAYRMLGSQAEADDAVQEAWLRLRRTDRHEVTNLGGFLTTVVARICLDALRSRKTRHETSLDAGGAEDGVEERRADPEQELLLANSLGPALMIVLDTLAPAERVAFVLHDLFGISFEAIAAIVGRTPEAARQLASRGRRRVQGARTPADADRQHQRELVVAFLAASRRGDFAALLSVLDPDVVLRADDRALQLGAARIGLSKETRGADAVARFFKGHAQGARLALVDGVAAAVWAPGEKTRAVFEFEVVGGRIVTIGVVADREIIGGREIEILEPERHLE